MNSSGSEVLRLLDFRLKLTHPVLLAVLFCQKLILTREVVIVVVILYGRELGGLPLVEFLKYMLPHVLSKF